MIHLFNQQPIADMREQLNLNSVAVQYPIGLEEKHEGVVDLVTRKALYFDGEYGERVREEEVPDHLKVFLLIDKSNTILSRIDSQKLTT